MAQASERPRRKRLSWESRCEIVARIEAGLSVRRWPRPAAGRVGRRAIACGGAISKAAGRGCGIDRRRRGVNRVGSARRRSS